MNRRMRMAGVVVLLAGAAVVTAGQNPPPTPPQGVDSPTFKLQVDYVEVDAVVTDQQGRFVRDLKKEDFQVFEDRKAQTISAFTLVDIPIERLERPLFAAEAIEPDIRTNARPFDGRIYIVVLDDLHVQPLHTQMVRRVMRKFIQEKLGANDLMAVVHVQGRSDDSQEFTGSKRLLLAAVDKFLGRAERPATVEAYEQYLATIGMPGAGISDPIERKRGFDARATLEQLQAIADWFGSVRGRKKTILFVSEGIEYDIEDMFSKVDASMIIDRTRDLIRSATKSNVSIYAIDPRGLSDMGDLGIELNSAPAGGVADDTGQVTGGLTEQQMQSLGLRGLQNELRLQHNSLRTLAEETGGAAFINSNNFAATFDRIVQDNSSYYVLAYYPPNPKRDGKFHNIQVRVNRPGSHRSCAPRVCQSDREGEGAGRQPGEPADHRGARGARQSAAGERPDHPGVRSAVQGHRSEGLGAARRGDARPRSAARRRRQGAAVVSTQWMRRANTRVAAATP